MLARARRVPCSSCVRFSPEEFTQTLVAEFAYNFFPVALDLRVSVESDQWEVLRLYVAG